MPMLGEVCTSMPAIRTGACSDFDRARREAPGVLRVADGGDQQDELVAAEARHRVDGAAPVRSGGAPPPAAARRPRDVPASR